MEISLIADQLIASYQAKNDLLYDNRLFKQVLTGYLSEAYGLKVFDYQPDIELFINAQSNTFDKEPNNIVGSVQLSPARKSGNKTKAIVPDCKNVDLTQCRLLYDSGAFSDVCTNSRVTFQESLHRQIETLKRLPSAKQTYLVSYDLLIDEKYVNGQKIKQRWSIEEGWAAVEETIAAAKYLSDQPLPYTKVLSCQGVDEVQYLQCVKAILPYCGDQEVLGLGGWCILGKQRRWLPTFYKTVDLILPVIASTNIKHVHIFGVTWYRDWAGKTSPLKYLLSACQRYGIKLSTDSRSPIANALWKDCSKSGAVHPYWRHNLAWVKTELALLSRQLPSVCEQLSLFA